MNFGPCLEDNKHSTWKTDLGREFHSWDATTEMPYLQQTPVYSLKTRATREEAPMQISMNEEKNKAKSLPGLLPCLHRYSSAKDTN